jgi:hypothetical protein
MINKSWQEDYDAFQANVIPFLIKHGQAIGEQQQTNVHAQKIIHYYVLLRNSFDPMMHLMLCQAIEKWKQSIGLDTTQPL